MNRSPNTEPSAIIVSMTLTALSVTFIDIVRLDSISNAWKFILATIIFIFAGTSTTQLYFSLIIPKLRGQINFPLSRERTTKQNFFVRYLGFYLIMTARFFMARCSVIEIRLLGYLNSLIAFSILFLVQLFNIFEKCLLIYYLVSAQ